MEVFFQVITLKRLRSAGVLDSRPRGMLGFNRLLVMLEPVTTLSDDDHQVPAAKSTAKAKSKAPTPKSSPKRPSPPETVPSPKQKAKAKAKSSSSHPPMKRPSAQAKSKASTTSAPTPPSAPPPKKGMKRPAATSELRVSKYFYKSTKIWGFKLNRAEKSRVSHLQTFLLCSMFDFSTLFMGCGDLLEVKPREGVLDEKIEEIAAPCMASPAQSKSQPVIPCIQSLAQKVSHGMSLPGMLQARTFTHQW